jgi:hypothetical protein
MSETVTPTGEKTPAEIFANFDSTQGAPLIWLLLPRDKSKRFDPLTLKRIAAIWTLTVLITWIPPLVIALVSGHNITQVTNELALPYLHDINMMTALWICLPAFIVLYARDTGYIAEIMTSLAKDGPAKWTVEGARAFRDHRQDIYKIWNKRSAIICLFLTLVVIFLNILTIIQTPGKAWVSIDVGTRFASYEGYWFLAVQLLCYWFMVFYQIARMIMGMYLLSAYARHTSSETKTLKLEINPLHPDRVGGLRPIARLGLQNQTMVAILSINLGALIVVLDTIGSIMWMGWLAAATYIVVAPAVFIGPLLPFRKHVLNAKHSYLSRIAKQFKQDLDATLDDQDDAQRDSERLDRIERLTHIHERISRLPEWPLDTSTITKSVGVFMSPVVSVLVSWLFKIAMGGD